MKLWHYLMNVICNWIVFFSRIWSFSSMSNYASSSNLQTNERGTHISFFPLFSFSFFYNTLFLISSILWVNSHENLWMMSPAILWIQCWDEKYVIGLESMSSKVHHQCDEEITKNSYRLYLLVFAWRVVLLFSLLYHASLWFI